ncbi:verrucotoxin subunit beta-like [Brachyhypopomus gauderio]|uniref:verrucotoxin subunit beta-like n=1 Tax=Brachyhypopomus gauderio TaxID=698409 RepID=UPI004040FC24
MNPKFIEISALGRPLYPGMLYDCRSDSFIPGVTLWDRESINNDLDVHLQKKTDIKFCFSDSLSDQTSLLDVNASLKASFMSGLVEVGGSAKYLNDKKTSAHQSRVIMQYSQTTRFEQLTMSHLGAITYPQVFEENLATHVITAVLYGAHAFLVFDQTATKDEDAQEIQGNLSVMIRNIFTPEGKGNIMMNDKEKKLADEISCTFHGDYEIEENPTIFKDALQLYKKLPSLLKGRDNHAVPVKVWLYPLAQLDAKAARLEREISVLLISKIEDLLEELEHGERTCKDLVKSTTARDFQDVMQRLKLFQGFLSDYKMLFLKAVRRLLPAIRGGEEKDQALTDVLITHGKSPFTATRQNKWLENVQSEVNLLDSYNRELKGCSVVRSSDLNQIIFNPSVDIVICFSFTSLKNEDQYLSSLAECLREDEFEKLSTHPKSKDLDLPAWFNNPDISERMKKNFSLFKHFSEANKENDKIRCVTAAVFDPSSPGTSIRLYRNGKMVDSNFQPVSKPPAPTVHIQNGNMVLKLQKSPTGVTLQYRVEYRADSGDDDDTWKIIDTPDAQETFTLTGLQLARKYWVRYRVVSEVGVSEASDTITFFHEGNVNVPVAKTWNWTTLSFFNELRKMGTSSGISYWSPSTIQSEVRILFNMNTTHTGQIPGGLKPGQALFFQGVVTSECKSFVINLKTGPKDDDDIVFHFESRVTYVVCNSFRNGNWETESNTDWCPFAKGGTFDMFMVITPDVYEVIVNGQMFCTFKHRMLLETVSTFGIWGDVFMNTFGIIEDWSTSNFSKELSLGTSRGKFSNIHSEVDYPVCNLCKTYTGQTLGELKTGQALFFQGVVPTDCNSFVINLKTGQRDDDDIAFHFESRVTYVVCNSFRNGNWEAESNTDWCPFAKGGAFDMFIVITPEGYEVIVNGQMFCTFKHRMSLETVSTLGIWGDVFINTFGIIEVESVNLKVTFPVHD